MNARQSQRSPHIPKLSSSSSLRNVVSRGECETDRCVKDIEAVRESATDENVVRKDAAFDIAAVDVREEGGCRCKCCNCACTNAASRLGLAGGSSQRWAKTRGGAVHNRAMDPQVSRSGLRPEGVY